MESKNQPRTISQVLAPKKVSSIILHDAGVEVTDETARRCMILTGSGTCFLTKHPYSLIAKGDVTVIAGEVDGDVEVHGKAVVVVGGTISGDAILYGSGVIYGASLGGSAINKGTGIIRADMIWEDCFNYGEHIIAFQKIAGDSWDFGRYKGFRV